MEKLPSSMAARILLIRFSMSFKAVRFCVLHHELEGRALIIAAGKVTVYVLFDNDIPVGFGVCHTIPALPLDALLGLTAAWGVAVVGDGGKQFFRVIFRHKKSTSEKWV